MILSTYTWGLPLSKLWVPQVSMPENLSWDLTLGSTLVATILMGQKQKQGPGSKTDFYLTPSECIFLARTFLHPPALETKSPSVYTSCLSCLFVGLGRDLLKTLYFFFEHQNTWCWKKSNVSDHRVLRMHGFRKFTLIIQSKSFRAWMKTRRLLRSTQGSRTQCGCL